MQQLIGRWNQARGVWETDEMDLLSEHSEPFSGTWPSSGMTRDGQAWKLETPERRTSASASSSSPVLATPRATRGGSTTEMAYALGGHRSDEHRAQGQVLFDMGTPDSSETPEDGGRASDDALLPTPAAADGTGGRLNRDRATREGGTLPGAVHDQLLPTPITDPQAGNGHARNLAAEAKLLPTPSASNPQDGEKPDTWLARRERVKATGVNGNGMGMPLAIAVQLLDRDETCTACGDSLDVHDADGFCAGDCGGECTAHGHPGNSNVLLPTPTVGNITGGNKRRGGARSEELLLPGVAEEVEETGAWGPYQRRIELWERTTGNPAPPATLPDGRGGAHRMNAALPEWMMGYAPGYLTQVPGVTRAQALKAAGNGVVPQQAAMAAREVLAGWD